MDIGENIRALRMREHMSQTDFAKRVGVTKKTVSRWENGQSFIRGAHLEKLAEALNVPVGDIVGDAPEFKSPTADEPDFEHASNLPNAFQALRYPVYKIERSGNGTTLRLASHAFAPPDVAKRHPASVFVRMDYREMTRLYPVGSLLLVDQRLKPYNSCTAVALVDNAAIVIRHYLTGNDTVVLSSWSHDAPSPDLMLDKRRVRIIGVVVWFQASHDVRA